MFDWERNKDREGKKKKKKAQKKDIWSHLLNSMTTFNVCKKINICKSYVKVMKLIS
jgi:hypothetical protein